MHVENTAAIVTGVGEATARALVERGASVFVVDLAASIETAAASGVPLRTVVNCAGIAPSMRVLGKKGAHDLEL